MSSSLASGLHEMPVVGDFIMQYLPAIIAVVVIAVALILFAVIRSRRRSNNTPPDPIQPQQQPQAQQRSTVDVPPTDGPTGSSGGGEYRGRHAK
ncbi:MAG: hypothetical protein ACOYIP_04440 [Coriobacteriales bacterium]|jgi:hypothetical protein